MKKLILSSACILCVLMCFSQKGTIPCNRCWPTIKVADTLPKFPGMAIIAGQGITVRTDTARDGEISYTIITDSTKMSWPKPATFPELNFQLPPISGTLFNSTPEVKHRIDTTYGAVVQISHLLKSTIRWGYQIEDVEISQMYSYAPCPENRFGCAVVHGGSWKPVESKKVIKVIVPGTPKDIDLNKYYHFIPLDKLQ